MGLGSGYISLGKKKGKVKKKNLNFVSHFRKWNNHLVHCIVFSLDVVPKLISNAELLELRKKIKSGSNHIIQSLLFWIIK